VVPGAMSSTSRSASYGPDGAVTGNRFSCTVIGPGGCAWPKATPTGRTRLTTTVTDAKTPSHFIALPSAEDAASLRLGQRTVNPAPLFPLVCLRPTGSWLGSTLDTGVNLGRG